MATFALVIFFNYMGGVTSQTVTGFTSQAACAAAAASLHEQFSYAHPYCIEVK